MKKLLASSLGASALLLLFPINVFAHVEVKPDSVGVAASQTFTVEVPTEKDNPTVGLKLVLPSGLQEVTPVVKSGWTIEVKKSGTGDSAQVSEINWTGGSIPTDQMDLFSFRAQVPSKEITLQWKAYQTYQDGSVVSWDQNPSGSDDSTGDKGPYSETKIVNDLNEPSIAKSWVDQITPYVAVLALALAVGLLLRNRR